MTDNDLNEQVNVTVDDASVITVPIDATLQNSNEAADAKAVGDALALKADKSELQAAVKVNNQPADAQGLILIDGRHIPVSDQDTETLANAVTDLKGKTAADIPMSSDSGAKTIAEVVNANSEAIEGMEEMTGATMPIESGSQTTVKAAIEARVKTVNRKAPDADGDVDLSVVPLAENLQSDKMESVEGSFIIRTTGGNASVSDGKAYPLHLFGASEHTGYVAEELNMTVIPITRTEPDEPITATIDRDTFVAYVDESSTINLYYTTEWSADPELYGITVTGTPEAGDQITVVYVKEVRGTITVANPARLVGTGWNLFDYNNGYARVVKYSTEYGYKIGGSYASLQFSATLTGERSSITPGVDGLFNVPSDGYVFVTGGNNTDTYILTTWSDWMEGPSSGYWEPYRESGIDLSAVMTTYFPNGLLAVGTTRDEIDLSAKRSISRIERMAYSEENRAAAAASGRSYDFDQNYIYIVRESAVISAITIDTTYNVSEHGLEWFTETTLPVISEILYGKNLRDKLERDVVTISAQTLTEEEKAQVRTNIGAMSQADGDKKLVAPTTAGTAGQLLHLKADGGTEWTTQGTPTDAQVGTAVSAWLTAHPEATTTVEDGAISRAKLNDDLKAKTDAVPDLKSALNGTVGHSYSYFQDKSISTYTPTTIGNETNWECALVECNEGDVFYVRGKGGNSNRLWFFSDTNAVVLTSAPAQALVTGYERIIAPENAKYLSVNSNFTIAKGALLKGDGIIQNEIDDSNAVVNRINMEQFSVKHNPSGSYSASYGWNGTQGYICSNLIEKFSYIGEITFKNTLNSNVTFGFAYIDRNGKCLKVFDCTGATGTKVKIDYITPAEGYFVVILKSASAVIVAYSTSEVADAIPCKLAFYNGLTQGEFPVEGNIYSISSSTTVTYPSFTIPTEQVNYQFLITRAQQIFYNKKIAFLGDSLTAGYLEGGGYVERPYPTVVKEDLHLSAIQNLGVASTSISPGGNPTRAMCERYTDINSNTDFIVIMGGTNDHVYGTPIGEITDTTSETFYGGLYTLFEGIRHDYPNARLIMCTPIQKSWEGNNTVSKKFIDYVNAIREMCEYCSVICLDLYSKSGLTFHLQEMKKYFLNPDQSQGGLHCNQAGYEYLGHKVALLLPTVI